MQKMPGVMELWKQALFLSKISTHWSPEPRLCQHVNSVMIAKSPKWCKAWGLHSDDESISSRCQTPKKRS